MTTPKWTMPTEDCIPNCTRILVDENGNRWLREEDIKPFLMKPALFTMPTEEEFVAWTKQEHLSLAELTAIKMYQRWLRDRMKPVTIAPLGEDEMDKVCLQWLQRGEVLLDIAKSFEAGYRACEARILKGS